MHTHSSSNLVGNSSPNPTTSNPKHRNRRRSKQPFNLEEPLENQAPPVVTMADQRTMAELLRAPTEGYAEAIVVPPILAEHFELKHSLINMMTSDQFFGLEKDNPHDHICWFNKITSTIKYKDVPNSVIKLMFFPFSLAGAVCRWLEKEPPHSILTWEDLVSKFINEFFPPSIRQISEMRFPTFNNGLMSHFMRHGTVTKISFVLVLITVSPNYTNLIISTMLKPNRPRFLKFCRRCDHLGKFDGKADEGYLVGYSASNRAYRVYNMANKRVEEIMNLRFLEEKANIQGIGTQDVSYNPAGYQDDDSDSKSDEQVILELTRLKDQEQRATYDAERLGLGLAKDAEELQKRTSAKTVPPGSIPVPTGSIPVPSGDIMVSPSDVSVLTGGVLVPSVSPSDSFFDDEPTTRFLSPSDLGNNEPSHSIFSSLSYDDELGADLNNLASTVEVSPVETKRINTIHPQSLILGDHTSAVQTRSKVNKTTTGESTFISYIHDQQRDNYTNFQHCMFACFLSQVEPRSAAQALEDPSWVDAMQEEMQQFKFQNVWVLIDLPEGKYAIGTKWILKNKREARGIVVRNKARLVAQRHRQEEGIDYDEVFAPVARIEAIRLFLAFASYMGFMVYQMDIKSAFLYGSIDEEHKRDIILVQVYVDDIIFGSTKKAWCDEFEALIKGEFEMSAMGELIFFLGLQVQQMPDGIFIGQDKYVQEILQKFDFENVRIATTPYEAPKPKSKIKPDNLVNVHLYRSMIGSLMYLTASRPDIMFAVSACSRNQVTPTTSNLKAVKKIFKYLKGQPKLGLCYPRESPFVLEAYSDSDYDGANKDRKSTTGGCQFLGRRLISWQCKKQTIVATSSTKAEYVAAANCCGQVLWIQNQLLDYGYNFMNTKIFIDNQSTICIVKNPVFHQRTKHIEIRHHFIRDANEKKLIQVLKIHTDDNVADLLTKAFDGPSLSVPSGVPRVPTGSFIFPTGWPLPTDGKMNRLGVKRKEVEANASLSKTLLGDDVTEDNFEVRMAALIKRKKQALVEILAKERMERPMTQDFEEGLSDYRSNLPPSIKSQLKPPFHLSLIVPQPPVLFHHPILQAQSTEDSLGKNRLTKPKSILTELDLDADDKTFIKFNKATKTANYMVLEGVLMKNKDVASSRDIHLICASISNPQAIFKEVPSQDSCND
ncbi:putative ribonuclease H-like domain-containing protein [Tanacetum coccineum]